MITLIDYNAGNLTAVHRAADPHSGLPSQISADPEVVRRADQIIFPGRGRCGRRQPRTLRERGLDCLRLPGMPLPQAHHFGNLSRLPDCSGAFRKKTMPNAWGCCLAEPSAFSRLLHPFPHPLPHPLPSSASPSVSPSASSSASPSVSPSVPSSASPSVSGIRFPLRSKFPTWAGTPSPLPSRTRCWRTSVRGTSSTSFTPTTPSPLTRGQVYAVSDYGGVFPVAIGKDNLFAVQFHTEKSGAVGLKLLENFARWKP